MWFLVFKTMLVGKKLSKNRLVNTLIGATRVQISTIKVLVGGYWPLKLTKTQVTYPINDEDGILDGINKKGGITLLVCVKAIKLVN